MKTTTTREVSLLRDTSINLRRENRRREDDEEAAEDEEDAEHYRMMLIEEEEWLGRLPRRKKRNTGLRPGGSNFHGRPEYWDSVWGKMLQNVDLQITGSTVQKVFMRRFRVLYKKFHKLVVWTRGCHEKYY